MAMAPGLTDVLGWKSWVAVGYPDLPGVRTSGKKGAHSSHVGIGPAGTAP